MQCTISRFCTASTRPSLFPPHLLPVLGCCQSLSSSCFDQSQLGRQPPRYLKLNPHNQCLRKLLENAWACYLNNVTLVQTPTEVNVWTVTHLTRHTHHRCGSAFSIGQADYGIMQPMVVKGTVKSDTHAITIKCNVQM